MKVTRVGYCGGTTANPEAAGHAASAPDDWGRRNNTIRAALRQTSTPSFTNARRKSWWWFRRPRLRAAFLAIVVRIAPASG